MKVSELINILQEYAMPDAKIELADGSDLSCICYNRINKRALFGTEDDFIPNESLAEGWYYIFTEN